MMNKVITGVLLIISMSGSVIAKPEQPLLDRNEISIGAGLARNSVDTRFGDFTETGFQFFAAYDLNQVNLMQGVNTSIELGYMDYGFTRPERGGLWITAVIDGAIQQNFGWLARLGLDLGDDSGLMLGAGLSFVISPKTDFRAEYVIRDEIDSIQFNLAYHL